MTPEIQLFLKKAKQTIGNPQTILEVGALNINGSARQVFQTPTNTYIGLDMCAGKDVDLVLDAHDMFNDSRITPEKFDLIICCETFEHDIFFWVTLENMKKALKKGGWLIITTPGIQVQKHNYPSDYYRFMGDAYKTFFFKDMADVFVEEYWKPDNKWKDLKPDEVHGYGRKI